MSHLLKNINIYLAKRRWLRFLLQGLLVLVLFIAINAWQTRNATKGEAPAFSGHLLNATPVFLEQYRGKPLLLHFWATWCPVCTLEQNTINSLASNSETRYYHVLTIASWSGSAAEVATHMQQENLIFPVLVDHDGSIANLYGVKGVPTSVVIDSNGVIQFVEQGYTTEVGLRLRLWWLKNIKKQTILR